MAGPGGQVSAQPFAPRVVVLPRARSLVVRPMRADDVDGLMALYDGLSDRDRYFRFFSGHRPPRSFFEQVARIAERGGQALVAEVHEPDRPPRLVADAWYSLLDDGDGELAITVAREWRGWLGPFLLDALVEVAAQHGVRNLRAEVLAENRAMLALVLARPHATVDQEDLRSLSIAIGVAEPVPSWPARDDGRHRLLVEGVHSRWRAAHAAAQAGAHVRVCPGPTRPTSRCPALAGTPCPLARDADVILVGEGLHEKARALIAAHRELHPGVPVCVEVVPGAVLAEGGPAEGVTLLERSLADDALVEKLIERSRRRARPPEGGG